MSDHIECDQLTGRADIDSVVVGHLVRDVKRRFADPGHPELNPERLDPEGDRPQVLKGLMRNHRTLVRVQRVGQIAMGEVDPGFLQILGEGDVVDVTVTVEVVETDRAFE